jgi:tetratricopeptide (TPR) repeat protein/thiol-disulfide isomerase/thioredoxin
LDAAAGAAAGDVYFKNWNRLSTLIAQGRSFSGGERNCVFLNTGADTPFAGISAAARLDWPDDGRALAVTDADGDGDLDLWMTQRNGPRVRFVRNDVSAENRYVSFHLESVKGNRDAIGARMVLVTSKGRRLHRTVRAGDGFLSQSTKALHFGLLSDETVEAVSVRWPGVAEPEVIEPVEVNRSYTLREGSGKGAPRPGPGETLALASSTPSVPASTANRRLVMVQRLDFPAFRYVNFEGEIAAFEPEKERPGPTLVNLWASWCGPCVKELQMFAGLHQALSEKHVEVVALSTDAIVEAGTPRDLEPAKELVAASDYPFAVGVIDEPTLQQLTQVQHRAIAKQLPLALPTSFLLDRQGKVGVLYFGPVTGEQLLADVALLDAAAEAVAKAAFPFPGRNGVERFSLSTLAFAQAYEAGGYIEDARQTMEALGDAMTLQERYYLGTLEQSQLNWEGAAKAYAEVLAQSPGQVAILVPLGVALWKAGRREAARTQFEAAERAAEARPQLWTDLGRAHLQIGEPQQAIGYFERSGAREHVARALVEAGRVDEGVALYEALLEERPEAPTLTHRLAWTLATTEGRSAEEIARALSLAQRLGEWTQRQDPRALDVLAAAHAQAGEFDLALPEAQRALRLARATGEERLAKAMIERLEVYGAQRPWREGSTDRDERP